MRIINHRLVYALLAVIASPTVTYAAPTVMEVDPNRPARPVFEPRELWNIDSKVDDGLPGMGELVVYGTDATVTIPSCTDASDNSRASAATAKYRINADTKECAAVFRNQF